MATAAVGVHQYMTIGSWAATRASSSATVAGSEPEKTTWNGRSRLAMMASSYCEYEGSVPRNRPWSPVSAVANRAALAGIGEPFPGRQVGMLVDHVARHEPADLADRAQLTDVEDGAVVEEGLLGGGDARGPQLQHRVDGAIGKSGEHGCVLVDRNDLDRVAEFGLDQLLGDLDVQGRSRPGVDHQVDGGFVTRRGGCGLSAVGSGLGAVAAVGVGGRGVRRRHRRRQPAPRPAAITRFAFS